MEKGRTLPRDLSQPQQKLEFRVRADTRERLDRYLLRRLGWPSRRKIQRLIQHKRVRLNGNYPHAALRIAPGDHIEIRLNSGKAGETEIHLPELLWEDPYLVALDKPPGRLVHPVGRAVSGTLINDLHRRYRGLNEHGQRPVVAQLCHRLDRDTSGVLLVAKTRAARRALQRSFEKGRAHK